MPADDDAPRSRSPRRTGAGAAAGATDAEQRGIPGTPSAASVTSTAALHPPADDGRTREILGIDCIECGARKARDGFHAGWCDWHVPVCEQCCNALSEANGSFNFTVCYTCQRLREQHDFPAYHRRRHMLPIDFQEDMCMDCVTACGWPTDSVKRCRC